MGGGSEILISRAILLKIRAIFLFMFCFTNILNIFFSFVTFSMHKNPHQNAGNGIKETLLFKISPGSMAPNPPRGSRVFSASRANSCPPPSKFLSPYAYASHSWGKFSIFLKMFAAGRLHFEAGERMPLQTTQLPSPET